MSEELNDNGPIVIDREKQKEKQKLQPPSKYKVVVLNDDFTPVDFVAELMVKLFQKSLEEAQRITMEIHTKGKGVAGIYPKDIAETKAAQVDATAQNYGHPLKSEVEEE